MFGEGPGSARRADDTAVSFVRWLELLGSSGIGKSYWFDQLCSASKSDVGPLKIIQRAGASATPLGSVRLRARFRVHSFRTGSVPYSDAVRWWMPKVPRPELAAALAQPTCALLGELQRQAPDRLRHFSAAEAQRFESWYRRRPLAELAVVLRWASDDDLVLFEEGAVQNNPALASPDVVSADVFVERGGRLPHRAIVLRSEPDRIVERRLSRFREGRSRLAERGRDAAELLSLVEAEIDEAASKAAWLERAGVEVVEVDVERDRVRVVEDLLDVLQP